MDDTPIRRADKRKAEEPLADEERLEAVINDMRAEYVTKQVAGRNEPVCEEPLPVMSSPNEWEAWLYDNVT